jgi:PAS domain S-box-containing protein
MLALVAIPLATTMLVIGGGAFLQVQTREAADLTGQSDVALLTAQELLGTTVDAETGVRGYALTGIPRFVDSFTTAQSEVPAYLARLNALAAADPRRAPVTARLDQLTRALLAEIAAQVGNVRLHRRAATTDWVERGLGKRHLDEFRAEIAAYRQLQTGWRAADQARLDMLWSIGVLLLIAAVLAALLTLALGLSFATAVVRRLNELAANAERFGRGDPLVPPSTGTDEIDNVAQTFARMADERYARLGALARYRLLSEVTSDIILFTDRTSLLIVEANAAALRAYGRSREELIGQPVMSLHDPEYALPDVTSADRESGVQFETVHRRGDGSAFPVEVRARTAEIDGKRVIVSTIRDVTEREGARVALIGALDRALEGTRLKSEFVATMSHEIRTPMNGVIGMSELLLRTDLSTAQLEYASTINESAQSLMCVINDILDFSKIEAGKLVMDSADFDVRVTLERVTGMLRRSAEAKGVELHLALSPHLPSLVRGDNGRLRQVLTNLIGNAIKFTEHGAVSVTANVLTPHRDQVLLEFIVADTGIGMPEAALRSLFEPFVQGDGSTTRRYGGTGLGLSICRRLVELMGGAITVESREGSGSVFRFTAPFEAPSAAPAALIASTLRGARVLVVEDDPTARRTAGWNGLSKNASKPSLENALVNETPVEQMHVSNRTGARLLIADDQEINRRITTLQLRELGFAADAAQGGREAVDLVRGGGYDLVLMDVHMPEMDGFAATHAIRESERATGRHVTIVALTAGALIRDRDACLAAGMDDYLAKPIHLDALRSVLDRWLPADSETLVCVS